MFNEYIAHNLFQKGMEQYLSADPQLLSLQGLSFVHPMDWWRLIRWDQPGIYILTGGRQIGKTTSAKLLLKHLLQEKIFSPAELFYLPCDQIDSQRQLGERVRLILEELAKPSGRFVLIVDEVTFVEGWDRAVKALADEGWFRKGFCILTGSDSVVLKDAAGRFPGRRGEAEQTDFHLHPLSFAQYVALTKPEISTAQPPDLEALLSCFQNYLLCGGYLKAINELHAKGKISEAVHRIFEQWIQGDFEKRGKSSHLLLGVLKNLFETMGSQITYSSLTHRMGEVSKETFIDYCNLLERMDVIFPLQAFDQNKKIGFPKKARKFHCRDPFIMDTLRHWLVRERLIEARDVMESEKVEGTVAAHCKMKFPTYYVKGKGEIDVIGILGNQIKAIEVKWTKQVRSLDASELKKFRNSVIVSRQHQGAYQEIPLVPVPLFLLQLG